MKFFSPEQCQGGTIPYNVNYNVALDTYVDCGASASVLGSTFDNVNSVCQSDINGLSYCNSCGTCIGSYACASDQDCPSGYACITGSACPSNATSTLGAPVCLLMTYTSDPAQGCRSPY